eukprot:jgi/Ulvmu1/7772/UM004_0001.1
MSPRSIAQLSRSLNVIKQRDLLPGDQHWPGCSCVLASFLDRGTRPGLRHVLAAWSWRHASATERGYSSSTSPRRQPEVMQPDPGESSSTQRHQVRQNALESISQGSSMTIRQWVFTRYAILATLQHSALMDMLIRRHEIAMACIARSILDSVSNKDSSLDSDDLTVEGTQHALRLPADQSSRSVSATAHYAVQTGETFKGWLHRLRQELPQARPSKRVYVAVSESSDDIEVVYEPAPAPGQTGKGTQSSKRLLGKALEPRTRRVLFEEGLPYAQFVAALGTQLLLPLQKWVRRAAQSNDGQPRRQLSQALLVESLLAIEAHSLAPLLLDDTKTRSPTRAEVEDLVQVAIRSRGIDYSIDPDQQLRLSMLALQLARQKTKRS